MNWPGKYIQSFNLNYSKFGAPILVWIALFAYQSQGFSQFDPARSPRLVSSSNTGGSPYCIFAALSQTGGTTLYIFAPNGEPLYYKTFNDFCYNFKLLTNGLLSYYDRSIRGFVLMDSLFFPVDTIKTKGFETDYHEFQLTDENTYILFGKDPRIMDLSTIIVDGEADATVVGNIIQELDVNQHVIFQWNSFDHFDIQDSYELDKFSSIDYAHFNSIEKDTDSTLILSSRNLSELTRINMNTGEIIWRMGGKNNQFEFRNFDRVFSGQHTIRKRQDNLYTLYDNGIHSDPQFSMGIEFTIDEDSMIAEKIGEFRHKPDVYSPIMGNLQNLSSGNTLISWGFNMFSEFDEDKNIVHSGRFINCDIPAYGVYKFPWKNHAFRSNREIVEFSSTAVGDSVIESVVIENNLEENLVINEFKWGNSFFDIDRDTITLLPGDEAILDIVFKPEKNGSFSDTLTLR
jgi:hypothetical protein